MSKNDTETAGTGTEETAAPAAPALNLSALAEDKEHTEEVKPVDVPEEVKAFVNRAHEFWQSHPKKWRTVTLGAEADAKKIANLARKFAKSTGRTFRMKGNPTENGTIVYKVTDPPTNGEGSDSIVGDAAPDAAPAAE